DFFGHLAALTREAFVDQRVRVEPVAVVVAALLLPQQVGVILVDELDPAPRRIVAFHEHALITIMLPDAPRHDDAGIAPARYAGEANVFAERVRREVGEATVRALRVAHVAHT